MNVYFNVSPNTRHRIWETITHLPPGISPILPDIQKKPDTEVSGLRSPKMFHLTKNVIGGLGWPNARWFTPPKNQPVDLIYAPGHLIVNHPFVVELDNPLVLTFYEAAFFNHPISRFIIDRLLTSHHCKGVICISQICKKGFLAYFPDPAIAQKTSVVYPYVQLNSYPRRPSKAIRLLFISTTFYLKGGRELVKAYLKLKKSYPNLRLTIITKIKPKIRRDYGGIDGIELVEAKYPKEELYQRFYCDADIFVVPSYLDSFGLVFLEAIASGLPVISTKMYAIPEIVEDGKNGFLIDPPLKLWHLDGTTSARYWETDLYDFTERQEFPDIVVQLEKLLEKLITDHRLRRAFSLHSYELVKHGKFFSRHRLKLLSDILQMGYSPPELSKPGRA